MTNILIKLINIRISKPVISVTRSVSLNKDQMSVTVRVLYKFYICIGLGHSFRNAKEMLDLEIKLNEISKDLIRLLAFSAHPAKTT